MRFWEDYIDRFLPTPDHNISVETEAYLAAALLRKLSNKTLDQEILETLMAPITQKLEARRALAEQQSNSSA
jgi:hypothetical protein